jgi:hypothetical protein
LSEEVDRILKSTAPPRQPSDPSQPAVRGPEPGRLRASLAPPRAPSLSRPELDDTLPESATMPRAPGTSIPPVKKPHGTDSR